MTAKSPAKPDAAEKTPKKVVDWEVVEKHYRAGLLSVREIGVECGVSHVAIGKRSKQYGWTRDLSKKIEQKARDLVTKAEVTKAGYQTEKAGKQAQMTDAAVVEVIAQKVAEVDLGNRSDVQLGCEINRGLLLDLQALCQPGLYERLEAIGEFMDESGPDASGRWVKDKINEEYRYIISIAGRIKMAKDLSASIGMFVPLQRKIVGLDVEKQATQVDDLLKKVRDEQRAAG